VKLCASILKEPTTFERVVAMDNVFELQLFLSKVTGLK